MNLVPETARKDALQSVLSNKLAGDGEAGVFLDNLRDLRREKGIKEGDVLKKVDFMHGNTVASLRLLHELYKRTKQLDPKNKPDLTPEDVDTFNYYMWVHNRATRGAVESVDKYFDDLRGRLPEKPGSFTRRFLVTGTALVLANILVPAYMNAKGQKEDKKKSPPVKPLAAPASPTQLAARTPIRPNPTATNPPRPAETPKSTNTPIRLPTETRIPPAATKPAATPTTPPSIEKSKPKALIKDIFIPKLLKRAKEQRATNPNKERAVDPELNKERINMLFLGMGNEAEGLTDTIIVLSYDILSNTIDLISLPRDLHAPEIDRSSQALGNGTTEFNAINTAYASGGNPLIRTVVEDATGLEVDLITRGTMKGFVKLVTNVFGSVEVDVPEALEETYLNIDIKAGKQMMKPEDLLSYAISRKSTSEIARDHRQQIVLDSLTQNFYKKWVEGGIIGVLEKAKLFTNLGVSLIDLQRSGDLVTDYDLKGLFLDNLFDVANAQFKGDLAFDKPKISKLVLDSDYGLVNESRSVERPHLMTIERGDYNAEDLPTGFWQDFRSVVKDHLQSRKV